MRASRIARVDIIMPRPFARASPAGESPADRLSDDSSLDDPVSRNPSGCLDTEVAEGDSIIFISTLHGG